MCRRNTLEHAASISRLWSMQGEELAQLYSRLVDHSDQQERQGNKALPWPTKTALLRATVCSFVQKAVPYKVTMYFNPEDVGSVFLQNICIYLQDYTASQLVKCCKRLRLGASNKPREYVPAQYSANGTGWTTKESGFSPRQGHEICLSSTMSRPALMTTHPPLACIGSLLKHRDNFTPIAFFIIK
jgi:hypothetical protein